MLSCHGRQWKNINETRLETVSKKKIRIYVIQEYIYILRNSTDAKPALFLAAEHVKPYLIAVLVLFSKNYIDLLAFVHAALMHRTANSLASLRFCSISLAFLVVSMSEALRHLLCLQLPRHPMAINPSSIGL